MFNNDVIGVMCLILRAALQQNYTRHINRQSSRSKQDRLDHMTGIFVTTTTTIITTTITTTTTTTNATNTVTTTSTITSTTTMIITISFKPESE
jgi:hypothetical protein